MGRFTNKTVIITGGARGIGYGIATAFAKEGANLVLTSIVQEELNHAKQTLEEEYGVKVLALYADGGDYSQVQTAVKNTVDAFGGIDVLINNAQASKSGVLFADHSVEDSNSRWAICCILLHERVFSVLKTKQTTQSNQFCISCRGIWQHGTNFLCSSKRRYSRYVTRSST